VLIATPPFRSSLEPHEELLSVVDDLAGGDVRAVQHIRRGLASRRFGKSEEAEDARKALAHVSSLR
jgi:hypothetical protein